ncbi:MAG: tRNA pseudouridine(38-40) synthase TruA [Acidimicrobiales bacterium]
MAEPTGLRRWRMLVAYDGSGFRGFAAQPGTATVAGALSAALARAARLQDPPDLVCAGRTDAGVHARGQVVHVDLPHPLPPRLDLARAVNRQLAPAVVVRQAEPAPEGFDARRSATGRRYRYLVHNAPFPDPLLAHLAWHVAGDLDVRAMRGAADVLVGEHDFRAFCRRPPGTTAHQPIVRRVTDAGWTGGPSTLLRFDVAAGSFCHQMVRSMVGALVQVGRGRATAADLVARLRSGTRDGSPQPAPPHGLCLEAVSYG